MRRSGIISRSKCANFSISQISCNKAGPRRPAVMMLVLSATGDPVALVNRLSIAMVSPLWGQVYGEVVRAVSNLSVRSRGLLRCFDCAVVYPGQADPRITLQKLTRLK